MLLCLDNNYKKGYQMVMNILSKGRWELMLLQTNCNHKQYSLKNDRTENPFAMNRPEYTRT